MMGTHSDYAVASVGQGEADMYGRIKGSKYVDLN